MKQAFVWGGVVLLALVFSGCAVPQGTSLAIDAAHRAVVADGQIVAVYHQAAMETFDQARLAHVATAKRIVGDLEADGKLTAPVVQEGFDRLLTNLDEVERRRGTFRELYRLAQENQANAKEALRLASDLISRTAATQDRIQTALGQAVTVLGAVAPNPTTPTLPAEETPE